MHVRAIRLKGDPSKREESMKLWNSSTLPLLKQQKGFSGVTVAANKETDEVLIATYWETEQSMKDGQEKVRPTAEKNREATGGHLLENDEYEVAVMERFKEPKNGAFVRLTTIEGNAAKNQEGTANFKAKVVPAVQKLHGVRSSFLFANATTGKAIAGSTWDTKEDLDKSEAQIVGLRQEAVQLVEGKAPKTEIFEIMFTEILAPTKTGG